jgi:hypothetical protein
MCRFCIRKSDQEKPDPTSGLMRGVIFFWLESSAACHTPAKAVSPDPMSGLSIEKL